jgi:hypothetical protein
VKLIPYGGWKRNALLSNGEVELVVTADVGPRIIRLAFAGCRNLFAEFREQRGRSGEKEWAIRGGHRLWIAPEVKPLTYEPDNGPVRMEAVRNGVRTVQTTGPLSGVRKSMEIAVSPRRNRVTVTHRLTNMNRRAVRLAPWALTVMAPGGTAIVPLPGKIPHTRRLTHNQEWSIWSYTDFADGRWTLGSRYVLFRQDRRRGPAKLGVAHREGWVAYQLGEFVFVKRFALVQGAAYPDGGVNFETFSDRRMLEVETLGPLADVPPGGTVVHRETWDLFRGVRPCRTERDVDRNILPLL